MSVFLLTEASGEYESYDNQVLGVFSSPLGAMRFAARQYPFGEFVWADGGSGTLSVDCADLQLVIAPWTVDDRQAIDELSYPVLNRLKAERKLPLHRQERARTRKFYERWQVMPEPTMYERFRADVMMANKITHHHPTSLRVREVLVSPRYYEDFKRQLFTDLNRELRTKRDHGEEVAFWTRGQLVQHKELPADLDWLIVLAHMESMKVAKYVLEGRRGRPE